MYYSDRRTIHESTKKFYLSSYAQEMLKRLAEYCGQAPSAPLYIREVPGSNPGAAWPGVGFFQRFPHTITSWYISYHR
jgi:uncharacterized protein (DUF885 family)